MNDILDQKLKKHLDDWMIRSVGIVDKNTFLVVADWEPKDNPKRKYLDGKDTFWTTILSFNSIKNTVMGKVIHGGLGKCHLDGGYIQGKKQALVSSYNGISYFFDYEKNTFSHEGIIEKVGIRDIKIIGNHFYLTSGACKIFKREKENDLNIFKLYIQQKTNS